jgi:putative membrane protein
MKYFKTLIVLFFKGMAMGAADVVPGVSGGTIAFITGIYERLIQAIKSVGGNAKLLLKGQFVLFWKNIDGAFLLCLGAGIAVSFLSLAHLMTYLLDKQPIIVWAFFFGLILASTYFVGKGVKWNGKTILAFALFAFVSFVITSPENAPLGTNSSYWYIFLCGGIAICAMILPGISGSFILVLLGQYYFLLGALKTFDVWTLFVFLAGAFIGIISFANVLSWLFKHFKMITLASLTGFMFGSLNKIWPWKLELPSGADYQGLITPEKNVWPIDYERYSGDSSQFLSALLLFVVGFFLIFSIEFISLKMKKTAPAERA